MRVHTSSSLVFDRVFNSKKEFVRGRNTNWADAICAFHIGGRLGKTAYTIGNIRSPMRHLTFLIPTNHARMRVNMSNSSVFGRGFNLKKEFGRGSNVNWIDAICVSHIGGPLDKTAYTIGNMRPPMRRLTFLIPTNHARMRVNMSNSSLFGRVFN